MNIDERGFTRQAGKVSIGAEDPDGVLGGGGGGIKKIVNEGLSSSLDPSVVGQTVTFTATVTDPQGGTPTGDVTFLDGSTTLGDASLTNGVASISTSGLPVGSDDITADYGGDNTYDPSSAALTQVVKAVSNTSLTSSLNPSTVGQSVIFTATVSGSSGTPTGAITFQDGTTVLGTATLDSNGNASFTTSALTVGSHNITANYGGDTTYATSSAALIQVVNSSTQSNSYLYLASSLNPSMVGQSVTFTARVTTSPFLPPSGPNPPSGPSAPPAPSPSMTACSS